LLRIEHKGVHTKSKKGVNLKPDVAASVTFGVCECPDSRVQCHVSVMRVSRKCHASVTIVECSVRSYGYRHSRMQPCVLAGDARRVPLDVLRALLQQ
jgi:hypothetical protein